MTVAEALQEYAARVMRDAGLPDFVVRKHGGWEARTDGYGRLVAWCSCGWEVTFPKGVTGSPREPVVGEAMQAHAEQAE